LPVTDTTASSIAHPDNRGAQCADRLRVNIVRETDKRKSQFPFKRVNDSPVLRDAARYDDILFEPDPFHKRHDLYGHRFMYALYDRRHRHLVIDHTDDFRFRKYAADAADDTGSPSSKLIRTISSIVIPSDRAINSRNLRSRGAFIVHANSSSTPP
jgi:hypothetical protein